MNIEHLEIGCGQNKQEGYFGIDLFDYPEVDLVVDVDKGLPFKNNTISKIYSSHVLEHVHNYEFVMTEIYRVCQKDAELNIIVPHFSGKSGFFEFHRRFFRYDSFTDFEIKPESMLSTETPINIKVYSRTLGFVKKWYYPWNYLVEPLLNSSNKLSLIWEETFLRNLFPAHEIRFKMRVVK